MDTYEGYGQAPLSLHRYLYAANNPVNLTDPTGLEGPLGITVPGEPLHNLGCSSSYLKV